MNFFDREKMKFFFIMRNFFWNFGRKCFFNVDYLKEISLFVGSREEKFRYIIFQIKEFFCIQKKSNSKKFEITEFEKNQFFYNKNFLNRNERREIFSCFCCALRIKITNNNEIIIYIITISKCIYFINFFSFQKIPFMIYLLLHNDSSLFM